MSYGRKHEGGNVRSYGINTTLKVVSLFFQYFFEGEGGKKKCKYKTFSPENKTKFKMSLLEMMLSVKAFSLKELQVEFKQKGIYLLM